MIVPPETRISGTIIYMGSIIREAIVNQIPGTDCPDVERIKMAHDRLFEEYKGNVTDFVAFYNAVQYRRLEVETLYSIGGTKAVDKYEEVLSLYNHLLGDDFNYGVEHFADKPWCAEFFEKAMLDFYNIDKRSIKYE